MNLDYISFVHHILHLLDYSSQKCFPTVQSALVQANGSSEMIGKDHCNKINIVKINIIDNILTFPE